jgi:hypothetical protein
MNNITCNAQSIVHGFPYHDGYVTSLAMLTGDRLTIAVRGSCGRESLVVVTGVRSVSVVGVLETCLINSIFWLPLSDARSWSELTGRIPPDDDGSCNVLWISSSYGADIVIVCAAAHIA